MKKTLGGERLGSGKKIKVDLHGWNRSTFNQSRIWRSTMACGTLVPSFLEIGTNGTTFDIDISTLAHTLPTEAPLFGSFKLQIDMFACPIRLYQGLLHNNMVNIGLNMSKVLLPKFSPSRSGQTQKSSLLNYIGLKGCDSEQDMNFNAIPILAYYDIFKNYYANKQEEMAKIIAYENKIINLPRIMIFEQITSGNLDFIEQLLPDNNNRYIFTDTTILKGGSFITFKTSEIGKFGNKLTFEIENSTGPNIIGTQDYSDIKYEGRNVKKIIIDNTESGIWYLNNENEIKIVTYGSPLDQLAEMTAINFNNEDESFGIKDFELENIDKARRTILAAAELNQEVQIKEYGEIDFSPYIDNMNWNDEGEMQGLCLKTYQSDFFNNWLNTENIDLINQISSVTATNNITMDALILAKKIYNMLNRIAVSGGTYEDWQEANYGENVINRPESPIYIGGASAEIMFEEVVSTAKTEDQPLATLGGKGKLGDFKGGHIIYKCDEPCLIMGIVSITPRIDYHQGNKWFLTELKNMDNLHKPGLDGIGFQNLMANQVHWKAQGVLAKQPAWLHYQTAVNEVFGNFAKTENENKAGNQSYMVLLRDYNYDEKEEEITDFTTYIDPAKFNYAFAENNLTAQNFWIQLGFKVESRRKMAAYEIPNL